MHRHRLVAESYQEVLALEPRASDRQQHSGRSMQSDSPFARETDSLPQEQRRVDSRERERRDEHERRDERRDAPFARRPGSGDAPYARQDETSNARASHQQQQQQPAQQPNGRRFHGTAQRTASSIVFG